MRAESVRKTPMGMLSRTLAGAAGRTLIINFPGSPRAVEELFGVVAPVLGHAVALLQRERGQRVEH
jgi:molybdopterin biosynthesis enzyme MoaB